MPNPQQFQKPPSELYPDTMAEMLAADPHVNMTTARAIMALAMRIGTVEMELREEIEQLKAELAKRS